MSRRQPDFSRQPERLQAYLDGLTQVAGHADRVVPIENYTMGLMRRPEHTGEAVCGEVEAAPARRPATSKAERPAMNKAALRAPAKCKKCHRSSENVVF
jgi:hypothetical protein